MLAWCLVSILTWSVPLTVNNTVVCECLNLHWSIFYIYKTEEKTYLWLVKYNFGETWPHFIFVCTKLIDEFSAPTWVTVQLRWVIAAVLDNEALRDAITVPSRLIYEKLITPAGALFSGNGFLETITEDDVMGCYAPQAQEWRCSWRWI